GAEAAGLPVSIHVALTTAAPGDKSRTKWSSGEFRFMDAPQRAAEFIYSGAFDRFPNLELVLAEVDCGWVPYVKEQMDDRYSRMPASRRHNNRRKPSAYFDRNLYYTYITDTNGIRLRREVGVDCILC